MSAKRVKAIGLLSGGLDSTLAVKLMLEQGIDVTALNFVTPFCTCTKRGCLNEAKKVADKFGIELKINRVGEEYIKIVKSPKYGYGKNMNPCIDCRIFIFSQSREYMEKIGAEFVFTGEVLGERPMSQRLEAMKIIENESGLKGRILRPLCAKRLPPTIPELEGKVARDKLLDITGRSRKPQMELAQRMSIDDYPCPAGGCRLTDPNFARRVKDAFAYNEDSLKDMVLLRYGRHFRLASGTKVIIGRNETENRTLSTYANGRCIMLELKDYPGPVTLLCNYKTDIDIKIAAGLCIRYSDYKGMELVHIKINNAEEILVAPSLSGNGSYISI